MLKARILTAVILFAAFLSALFFLPPVGWVVFSTTVAALAAWEWGALMGLRSNARLFLGAAFALMCALLGALQPAALGMADGFVLAAWQLGRWLYVPAAFFWLLVVPMWMKRRWVLQKSVLGVLTGIVLIMPTWLALVQLRQLGEFTLISIMAIVWLADIAAYFFGRRFGRHKLAPSISPGKTWEGALGGGLVVVAYGFSFSSKLPEQLSTNALFLFLVLLLLTAISIIGDLFESLLKRQAGLKDSSNLLPGHGGVLDRIDSLTSTLPLVALVGLLSLT